MIRIYTQQFTSTKNQVINFEEFQIYLQIQKM